MQDHNLQSFEPEESKFSVNRYEEMLRNHDQYFFDSDAFEGIIDYYGEKEEIDKASQVVEYALNQHPLSAILHIKKAQICLQKADYNTATACLDKAESLDPSAEEIPFLRGNICEYQMDYDNAILEYEKTLQNPSKYEEILSEIYAHLAFVYQQKERYEDSLKMYKKILEQDAENQDAIYGITYCYDVLNRREDALKYLNQLIDRNAYSYVAWYNLGIAYALLEMHEKAIEAFDYAILIKEDYAIAYYSKGDALSNLERYEDAIKIYLEALEYGMPKAEIYCALGECYENLDKMSEARDYYKKAVKLNPFMAEALYGIGVTLDQEERFFEASFFYQKAVDIDAINADYWFSLAEAKFNIGDIETAKNAFTNVTQLNPTDTEAWINLATIHVNEENFGQAVTVILEGIQNNSDCADLYYRLCVYLLIVGETEEAINVLQVAYSLDKNKLQIIFELLPELHDNTTILDALTRF